MDNRRGRLFAALLAVIALGGCAYGTADVRQDLGRILAARSPLPAHEGFVLPAAHRVAPPVLPSPLASRDSVSCTAQPSAEARTLIVQPGDTLSGIARRVYGGFAYADQLAAANRLADPDLIYPGQVLRLPASASSCTGEQDGAYRQQDAPARLSRRAFSSPSQRQPELRNVLATADDRDRAARAP